MEFTTKYLENLIEYINEQTVGITAGEVPFNEFLLKARDTEIYAVGCNAETLIPVFDFKYKVIRQIKINSDSSTFSYLIKFNSNKRFLHRYAVVIVYNVGVAIFDQIHMTKIFDTICDTPIKDAEIENLLLDNIKKMYDTN